MLWIIPALAAPFINAIVNFVDKYLVTKQIKNPLAMQLYTSIVSFCIGTLLWAWLGFPFFNSVNVLLGLGVGFIYAVVGFGYYFVISRKDVSEMVFLLSLTPVFILLLSFLFLHETISSLQLLGFGLVLSAVILVTTRRNANIPLFSFIAILLVTMDILWSVAAVMAKHAINLNSFSTFLIYDGWGLGLGGIFIYAFSAKVRKAFWENFKSTSKKAFGIIGLNETLSDLAGWVSFFAFSIGPVALVSAVGGIRSFYAILIGFLLTITVPSIIHEDVAKEILLRKMIAAGILIVGLYCINA